MKRKRPAILTLAPALAVMGVASATLSAPDPASRFSVPLLAVLGLLLTELLARLQVNRSEALLLRNLIFLGIAVRLVLFTVIHQTVGPYLFAPDQLTYEDRGMRLLNYWLGRGPFPSRMGESLQIAYPAMNAGIYAIFGFAKAAPSVVNMFLSAWTAIPVYHLAMLLVRRNEQVARLAAALTVFFPSLVLWSVLNIREAPTILTLTTSLYFCVRVQRLPSFGSLAGVIVGLAILTLFREYLTVLLGTAAVAGILMGRSTSPVRAFVAGSVLLISLAFAARTLGFGVTLAGEPSLDQLQAVRQGFLFGANSAYGSTADVSTPLGALTFLPVGLAYFMLAPFPWEISSTLQALTLPETLIWYSILPLGVWGMWLAVRHDARMYTVPLAALVLITFAYALVEANSGTAYRHRAQFLPLIFIFCALGIRDYQALRAARRARDQARRRRAKEVAEGRLVLGNPDH